MACGSFFYLSLLFPSPSSLPIQHHTSAPPPHHFIPLLISLPCLHTSSQPAHHPRSASSTSRTRLTTRTTSTGSKSASSSGVALEHRTSRGRRYVYCLLAPHWVRLKPTCTPRVPSGLRAKHPPSPTRVRTQIPRITTTTPLTTVCCLMFPGEASKT